MGKKTVGNQHGNDGAICSIGAVKLPALRFRWGEGGDIVRMLSIPGGKHASFN
ncbi:hypothetical protein [Niabella sp.]|uniref:hypothetical protein n=1 Tax=Niabella sp. TaxID=1962976 RepID=UPI002636CC32|nr:hypothetical protein [Niabella sp.]